MIVFVFIFVAASDKKLPVPVIPQGIESVNGSAADMRCSELVNISHGREVCCHPSSSYLLDGLSPTSINTSSSNWASQLVTVKKNDRLPGHIDFPHVLLTFIFDRPVSPTFIEMEVFHCPDQKIGASYISVHANNNSESLFDIEDRVVVMTSPQQLCNSLSTVTANVQTMFNRNWYILVDLHQDTKIKWVYIGDVKFLGLEYRLGTYTQQSTCQSMSSSFSSTIFPDTSPASNGTSSSIPTSAIPHTKSDTDSPFPATYSLISSVALEPSVTPQETTTVSPPSSPRSHFGLIVATTTLSIFVLTLVAVLLFIVAFRVKCKQQHMIFGKVKAKGNNTNKSQLEVQNPMYSRQEGQRQQQISSGNYTELDSLYTEVRKTAEDKTVVVSQPGEYFIGMYNQVCTTKTKTKDDIDTSMYAVVSAENESAGYAIVSGELMYDLPDNSFKPTTPKKQNKVPEIPAVENFAGPQIYSHVQVREVPAVPAKSSDLLEYLDTESALNAGVHSEPINHLDFTRNRFQGGGEGDPQFLGPFIPESSALPESYQQPAEVTSENITEKMKLGTGQFGQVVLASTRDVSLKSMRLSKTDDKKSVSVTVAVKKLRPNPSEAEIDAFGKEAQFMSQIKHPNVLRLLGVCHQHTAFIMMKYTERGDLNQFLQQFTEIVATSSSSESQISASELVYMASQIACGMQYLAQLNFVHRDLATRSCFVGASGSIKVECVGVKTGVYQSSYYQIRGNRMMPIRWMAIECFSGKFSEKSDMWAFGVTLWELFSLAKQLPYPHLSDEKVIYNAMKREYRQFPVKPVACPQSVYEVMEICWAVDMRQRATFQKLMKILQVP